LIGPEPGFGPGLSAGFTFDGYGRFLAAADLAQAA
jgi:hypothetical protein